MLFVWNIHYLRDSTSEVFMQLSDEFRKHVIVTFPNHFQVPEALKSSLVFGSFDSELDKREMCSRTGGDNETSSALHSSQGSDETAASRFVVNVCYLMCMSVLFSYPRRIYFP